MVTVRKKIKLFEQHIFLSTDLTTLLSTAPSRSPACSIIKQVVQSYIVHYHTHPSPTHSYIKPITFIPIWLMNKLKKNCTHSIYYLIAKSAAPCSCSALLSLPFIVLLFFTFFFVFFYRKTQTKQTTTHFKTIHLSVWVKVCLLALISHFFTAASVSFDNNKNLTGLRAHFWGPKGATAPRWGAASVYDLCFAGIQKAKEPPLPARPCCLRWLSFSWWPTPRHSVTERKQTSKKLITLTLKRAIIRD